MEIKKCLCGCNAYLKNYIKNGKVCFTVECDGCEAITHFHTDAVGAINEWNKEN